MPLPTIDANMRTIAIVASCCALALVLPKRSRADEVSVQDRKFFETKIRPVLVEHCYECHAAESDEVGANLFLDRPSMMRKGGQSGAIIQPGKPEESLLIHAIRYNDPKLEMPPSGPLKESVVNDFVRWIQDGAKDPRPNEPTAKNEAEPGAIMELDPERHWSFFPRTNPVVPSVVHQDWAYDPIDAFVMKRIEANGLAVASDADARTLVRRLYYDLIGLPPSFAAIERFEEQHAIDPRQAIESLVDRLLEQSEFGERWGRHWLDVARYGESNGDDGLGRNATFPHAWRYRDYVIDALNRDLPYDQFLREQIAGDLLESRTAEERNRRLTATGFLAIGAKPAAAMNKNFAMDIVDDQINVVSSAVLGLSVACARCHDHKHDPITARDYYAFAGIFSSTETLYGRAGDEKLTAPPTPLHQLRADLTVESNGRLLAKQKKPPKFISTFVEAIKQREPVLYEPLQSKTDALQLDASFKATKNDYATVNDTKIHGALPQGASSYTVSFWFKNNLKNNSRPITAYLFSRAKIGDKTLPGDHLGIGGTHDQSRTGKLFLFNGNQKKQSLAGDTVIPFKTWNHVIIVREQDHVRVFLNGLKEIEGQLEPTFGENTQYCLSRRSDRFAPLSGNVGGFTTFDRALPDDDALAIYDASGWPRALAPMVHPLAMGVRDKPKPAHCKIHINGDGAKKGPEVPRGYLAAYQLVAHRGETLEEKHGINPKHSGRLELANWLSDPLHPQTARVFVNRVWMHLCGRPIVETPDDFGVYGARPTHPKLLDHLANRFVSEGWSIKRLVRSIVLSRTYALSSRGDAKSAQLDPDNQFFARHRIRRLETEALRDSILVATGELDLAPGVGSAIQNTVQLINWPPGEATNLHRETNHRSVYLCFLRHDPPSELAAFDLPPGVAVTGQRNETTLPTQSLFLLNSKFVISQSERFASTLVSRKELNDSGKVQAVFRAILNREAMPDEVAGSIRHVQSIRETMKSVSDESDQRSIKAWASLCQALLSTNEFRYID